MQFTKLVRWGVASLLYLSCLESAQAASPTLLSSLVSGGSVSANSIHLSPDGTHVLYHADLVTNNIFQIYSVPINGGTPITLNGALPTGGNVLELGFNISPDGSRVLYVADQDVDNRFEVYTAPATGGSSVKLNGTIVSGGSLTVAAPKFSPDSSRVLYYGDQETDNVFELFSSPATFNSPVKLNGTLPISGDVEVSGFQFSPNSNHVIYVADQDTNNLLELFSVPATGGSSVQLNGTLVSGGQVFTNGLSVSPDSNYVVYVADQNTDNVRELYSVPIGGGTSVKLNASPVSGGDIAISQGAHRISPDGARVVYHGDLDTDDVQEIYSAPIAGGTQVKLNAPLVSGGGVFPIEHNPFSPDGSKVLYFAEQDTLGVAEIYVVPTTGGTPTKLNGSVVSGGFLSSDDIQFTPDGSRVLYSGDQDIFGVVELYSVPTAGGTPVKLNQSLSPDGDVLTGGALLESNGDRTVFLAYEDASEVVEIYLVPTTGGTPVKINSPLSGNDDAFDPQFTANGSHIVYTQFNSATSAFEVYSRVVELEWDHTSGDWDTAANWDQSVTPDQVMQVTIDVSATVTATGSATTREVNQLRVGGGSGTSTLVLASGAAIDALNGVRIDDGGVIRGDGEILGDVINTEDAEVRTAGAQSLHFGGSFDNQGQVEAIGDANDLAEIEFDGTVTNSASTGLITGRHAQLRFNGGLANEGAIALSAGETDVFGEIENDGDIVVSGGAAVTFYDDVTQNNTLSVSQVGATNSVAVFFGAFTGSGGTTGGGDIFFEGDLRPGNSPAEVTMNNDVFFGSGATLTIEIGGTTAGSQYDRLEILGEASLGGELEVTLVDLGGGIFQPDSGDEFEILFADDGRSGTFAEDLPNLRGGLYWDIVYDNESVLLVVEGAIGDYNLDGKVSAADFTVWRDTLGSTADDALAADGSGNGVVDQDDLQVWKDQYGEGTFGSGAGDAVNSASIPEPTSFSLSGLVAMILVPWLARRRSV